MRSRNTAKVLAKQVMPAEAAVEAAALMRCGLGVSASVEIGMLTRAPSLLPA